MELNPDETKGLSIGNSHKYYEYKLQGNTKKGLQVIWKYRCHPVKPAQMQGYMLSKIKHAI